MPIGDLLAQISGDKSQSTSPAPSRPSIAPPKRKADDDLRSTVSNKIPRTSTTGTSSSATSKPVDAQRPARPSGDKPPTTTTGYRGSAGRPSDRSATAPRHVGNGTSASKPSSSGARPLNGSSTSRTTSTLPSRPSPSAAAAPPKGAPPKKGSFAEIMARAQQAQTKLGPVGRIQHKPVEKVLTKKEREESRKDVKRDPKASARQPSKFQGSARPSSAPPSRNGTASTNRHGSADRAKDPRGGAKARAVAEEEQQKKLKKAAIATTGYTGTARPRPGAASTKKKPAPGGALLNARPTPRHSGSTKRSRYDDEEEDEELDDFIEYDEDEEDAGGPRYTYDSDGSSDMEAGMDDVWEEEAKAERQARKEDIEQERLERRLKAEKEERKRRFLEQQRARR